MIDPTKIPAEHVVKYQSIQRLFKVHAPIVGVGAAIVAFLLLPHEGTIGEYRVIVAGFCGLVVYIGFALALRMRLTQWEKEAERFGS